MNKKFRKGFVFGLALVFVAAVVMAAIPTHYVTSLFVKNIYRLSENQELTIGASGYDTRIHNASFRSGVSREATAFRIDKPTVVDLSGTSYYNITKATGSVFWINDHESTAGTRVASGVSIMLSKITSDMDGMIFRIVKMPVAPFSGTTVVVVSTAPWVSGTTDHVWNVTTGVTNETAAKVAPELSEIDAVGDWLEFTAKYAATGSTYFQTGRYIQ